MRGVCRDCHQLGPGELAFRQAVVNIDRALRHGELIPTRHRHMIDTLARHQDTRIRSYAAGVIERDAVARRELAESYRDDERSEGDSEIEPADPVVASLWEVEDAEDIPF